MSASDTLTLRPAEPSDAPLVSGLVRAAYARWVPVIGREPMPMRADYGRAIAEHVVHVAVLADDPVGVIETVLRPDHLWIENIAIHPDRQGAGLGRQLLAFADRLARSAGLHEVRLLTNGAFVSNIRLYASAGFAVTREETFMNGVTVYMSKTMS